MKIIAVDHGGPLVADQCGELSRFVVSISQFGRSLPQREHRGVGEHSVCRRVRGGVCDKFISGLLELISLHVLCPAGANVTAENTLLNVFCWRAGTRHRRDGRENAQILGMIRDREKIERPIQLSQCTG